MLPGRPRKCQVSQGRRRVRGGSAASWGEGRPQGVAEVCRASMLSEVQCVYCVQWGRTPDPGGEHGLCGLLAGWPRGASGGTLGAVPAGEFRSPPEGIASRLTQPLLCVTRTGSRHEGDPLPGPALTSLRRTAVLRGRTPPTARGHLRQRCPVRAGVAGSLPHPHAEAWLMAVGGCFA